MIKLHTCSIDLGEKRVMGAQVTQHMRSWQTYEEHIPTSRDLGMDIINLMKDKVPPRGFCGMSYNLTIDYLHSHLRILSPLPI
jgi:hypothetical protein